MSRLTLESAKEALQIDKNALDEVCIQQSVLFDDVSDKATNSRSERDAAKGDIDELFASLSLKIRQDAGVSKAKVTEGNVQAQIQANTEYQKANEKFLDLKNEAELWENRKQSFLQRSSMIKLLCELYLSGYYEKQSISGSRQMNEISSKSARQRLAEGRE